MKKHDLDRRALLRGLAATGTVGALGGTPFAAPARLPGGGRPLVLVQLTGGNDGLSTVVPFGDDAYHAARKGTRHSEVLALDEYRGLHPELTGLRARYDAGSLAIVEGVGYPDPNRSHFKSYEIWHTADARGRSSGDGWVGRTCQAAFGNDARPNRIVHVGAKMPYSLQSSQHPAAVFSAPAGYRWVKHAEELEELDDQGGSREKDALTVLRERMREARASSLALRGAVTRYRTPIEYPNESLAETLHSAAAILDADIGTRVLSVELGGFDTHTDERARHDQLMRTLDLSLTAFLDDLERSEVGRDAVVVVFSEFGRRVAENGSRGTDHGTAGPVFVAGARVTGGLYGAHPSLTELDAGDLVYTTDFRSVYGEVIRGCFDVPAQRVLGERYPRLGFLA